MTFYEAALRVLEQSGKPLSHIEITTKSIEGGLLSHVGKLPEQVMLARLAAMARRPRDRKVMVTAKDTFALTDWMLEEDAAALAATGIREPNPEEDLPPLRPIERHPEPRTENARGVGRQADRRSRRDEERERRRKYPPIAEVVFELLSESSPLTGAELLEKARAKEQASDELQLSQVLWALVEDNQRRIDSGRRPQFHYTKPAEGEPVLSLDAGSELPPAEVQQNFCTVAQIPFENGRAVLRQRPSHDAAAAVATPLGPEDLQLVTQARQSVKDARRVLARAFRKKLLELELGVLEKAVVRLLHALRFREVKVAKRSREGLLMMARRREGSLELRYALRLLRGAQSVERRHVQELKRDASHHGANVGIVVAPGDVRGDAKSEALSGALTFLWCGEGLADQFFDAEVGVIAQKLTLCEVDEAFFAEAARAAEEAKLRREERRNEREQERGGEGAPAAESSAPRPPSHAEAEANAVASDDAGPDGDGGPDDGEGDDDGPEGAADAAPTPGGTPGQPGQPGEGRRRRRRRRGRRGKGPRPEGQAGSAASPGGAPSPAASSPGASTPAPASAPPPPTPAPEGT